MVVAPPIGNLAVFTSVGVSCPPLPSKASEMVAAPPGAMRLDIFGHWRDVTRGDAGVPGPGRG
eukprot:CAMPEP_0179061598 /NCGR_PEP_ID=MMETSP0796-20121207/26490_1 /TAXON_ID=73915 /ORGANISM="Pyrodinium bahamense, Strain pbaha01" /LENGTH=62 /DNA_ID=CAMNT_0020758469 /DNA_START=26 /DNA_END=210 /DNA_ORIENTATION=+